MLKRLARKISYHDTGLDLCFIVCQNSSRVMWKTRANRWCLYWNHSNPRSKRWLSAEVHVNRAFTQIKRIPAQNGATVTYQSINPPHAKTKVFF